MKSFRAAAIVGLAVASISSGQANDPPKPEHPTPVESRAGESRAAQPRAADSPEAAAIRRTAETFTAAFNAGDAKAVAEHWTPDGEYLDEDGERTHGRDAIAKKYAAFFAANAGVRIETHIDRLRPANRETLMEDGTAEVTDRAGATSRSRYSVVHVKRDGSWRMWSVRDEPLREVAKPANLHSLDWLIGAWTTENKGVEYRVTCRWVAEKHFVEQAFEAKQNGKTITSGRQIIGWDPERRQIASWMFTSDGGHAVGIWFPQDGRFVVEADGVLADGTKTSAVNITSKLDDKAVAWRSVNRMAGGSRLPDTEEVILKRVKVPDGRK